MAEALQGSRELIAGLKGLSARIQYNVLRTGIFRIAQQTRDLAKDYLQQQTRRRTGNLLKSIKARRSRADKGEVAAKVEVGMFYGRFIERGTSKMSARPFMLPAFEQIKEKAVEEMTKAVKAEVIKKLTKK